MFAARLAARAAPKAAARRQLSSMGNFLKADEGKMSTTVYHYTSLAALGLMPVALVASPSALNVPIDLALGVILPLHGHIGMNYVITDYVPKLFGKAARGPARMIMAGITGVTVLGLLKLNIGGPGLTESVKGMWRKPAEAKKE